ncbi:alpha-galactosidase [Spirochaetota bacterium]
MKIVLVGAGSAQFGCGTLGDIFMSRTLKGSEVVLHDINEEALDSTLKVALAAVKEHSLDYRLSGTVNRREAFRGADFIISSIEVGNRFLLWDEDWKVPLQYGIHQVYGENGGPGGIFHSLRIIPHVLDIVRDAMEICPKAYIFNYSNPMTAICTAVKRAFPDARFIGLCHEIGWLYRWLPRLLSKNPEDFHFRAAGLNHFSCMLEIRDKKSGKDLYPEVKAKAEAFFSREPGYSDLLDSFRETGTMEEAEKYEKSGPSKAGNYYWADKRIAKFMLENYGLLPITTDSHFGEYISWAADIADHRGILDFYDIYKVMMAAAHDRHIKLETKERVVPIIDGILGNEVFEEAAVNIQNNGIIKNLPDWICVEVPAIVDAKGVNGLDMGELPRGYAALLRSYCGVYDMTAEAAIHKRKDYAIQALLANPVVNKASHIKELMQRMIDQQNKWLGYLK